MFNRAINTMVYDRGRSMFHFKAVPFVGVIMVYRTLVMLQVFLELFFLDLTKRKS